jgi:hypothetical protein
VPCFINAVYCIVLYCIVFQKSSVAQADVPVHDSPPTLDLSILEPDNFALSSVVSVSQSQPPEPRPGAEECPSQNSPSGDNYKPGEGDSRFRWQTTDRIERKAKFSESSYNPQTHKFTSISPKRIKIEPGATEESEVFFPLSVSAVDSINTPQTSDLTISGQMPGTPSSGTSDSNQGPVPISGPIPSSSALGMPPGVEGAEKVGIKLFKTFLVLESLFAGGIIYWRMGLTL